MMRSRMTSRERGDSLSKQQLHVPLARRKQPKREAAPSVAQEAEAEQSPAKTSTPDPNP